MNVASWSSAQTIDLVFPAPNDRLSFFDLTTDGPGFQWIASAGIESVSLVIRNPLSLFLPELVLSAPASPYHLSRGIQQLFQPGNFEWFVRARLPDGTTVTSPSRMFQIIAGDIRPTPTPLIYPTPSGDANRSARIDAPDIFILASQWGYVSSEEHGNDLNRDGKVDFKDVLSYVERYGRTAVPPTPTPAIGAPRNVVFEPNNVIGFAELQDFRIRWTPPTYPSDSDLLYEIVIVMPDGFSEIFARRYLDTPYVKPPTTLTMPGEYAVYLRAKNSQGLVGNITTAHFTVDQFRVVTPTPTPMPVNIDFSGDGQVNGDDSFLFSQMYGTQRDETGYSPQGDLVPDGVIDQRDLVVFQNLFAERGERLAAPAWISLSRPIMERGSFNQCNETGRFEVPIPPLDISFEQTCVIYAEINASRLLFALVEGAAQYYVITYGDGLSEPLEERFLTSDELNQRAIQLGGLTRFLFENIWSFRIVIQSADTGLQLGNRSESLHLVIQNPQPTG